jgi:YidC/Oxa1 family membrane protein insertase
VTQHPNDEMSHQHRTMLAAVLCLLVIIAFSYLYKPAAPQQSQTANAPAAPSSGAQESPAPASQQIGAQVTGITSAAPTTMPAEQDAAERAIVVEGDRFHIQFSNKGAVAKSWVLERYTNESTPPKKLDVIHPETAAQFGGWPLAVLMEDPNLEARANSALYKVTTIPPFPAALDGAPVKPPVEVDFAWSDGHLSIVKKFKFDESYIAEVGVSAKLDGQPVPAAMSWQGGFGDATAYKAVAQEQVFYNLAGKLNLLLPAKLGQPNQPGRRFLQSGPLEFAGVEDQFFAVAFLPPLFSSGPAQDQPDTLGASMTLTDWSASRDVTNGSSTTKEIVPEAAVGSAKGEPLNLRLFVGPKDLDDLKLIRPPLNQLVQFGWFAFIAEPLFYALKWTHKYVPNYGWAIVLLTFALNMALLPMKIKQTRSMQKMQKVGPEIKAIQDRYKKYSMKDPRKAKMNEEVMAVYNREGVNPLGSCWPMLIQMPIWYGLYEMLRATIELRHAPWFGWLHDLSAPDPYYILPILMGITMYVSQKMTPTPSVEPAQQRMMMLMPIMFGGMFIIFPIASGLVLYIFSSYLVNIGQQYFLNKSMPMPAPAKPGKKK